MAILASEIVLMKSKVVTNDNTNGGRLSINQVASGVANAVFPVVTEAQRTAGYNDYRKLFYQILNDADLVANNARLRIPDISPAGTRCVLMAATQRDTQGNLTGSERKFGPGRLNADVSSGATVIVVDAEAGAGADLIFQAGDLIEISDGTNEEFATIDAGGVSWATDQATITLAAGLTNSYTAATPTMVGSILEQAVIQAVVDNWQETSTSGTYDEVTNPLVLSNLGTIEETWTLTFSDATNFAVSGDSIGSVGSGSTAANFAPNNPDYSRPYFTLPSAGWGGTWAAGETIVFQTHPIALPAWVKRITPAGTPSFANDGIDLKISIESA